MNEEISLEHLEDIERGEPVRLLLITPPQGKPFTEVIYNLTPRDIAAYIREFHPGARYEEI